MDTSRTNSNWPSDICLGNICLGHICPYQEYLSCYQLDFDQTLKVSSWEHLKEIPTVMVIFSCDEQLQKWRCHSVLRVFKESFKDVSRKFNEFFKEVSIVFQGSFRETLRAFQIVLMRFQGVSGKCQGCFKKVSITFLRKFQGVSRKFHGYFKKVSRVFQG